MPRIERALIVGAGLAGAALACVLRQTGLAVEWIEKRPGTRQEGAGMMLPGNAMRALDRLDLGKAARRQGRQVDQVRFTDLLGATLFSVQLRAQSTWPDFVCIHRAHLLGLLLKGALPLEPSYGCTLESLEPGPRRVRARLSDGRESEFDLVVGADGLHSQVRAKLFSQDAPEPIPGFTGWRFITGRPPGLNAPLYMLGSGRTLLLQPLAGGEVYCGAGPVLEGQVPSGGTYLGDLRTAFAGFEGHAREVIDALDDDDHLLPTRYWSIHLPIWHQGQCLLIGDAGHACAPTLAQGAAMAFEDALVLGELLSEHQEPEALLVAFESRRRPRVEFVQRESLSRMEANRLAEPRQVALRDSILRKIGASRLIDAWGPLMDQAP